MSENQQKPPIIMEAGKVYNVLGLKPELVKPYVVFKNQADPVAMINDLQTIIRYADPNQVEVLQQQLHRALNTYLWAQIGFPETTIEEIVPEQQEN